MVLWRNSAKPYLGYSSWSCSGPPSWSHLGFWPSSMTELSRNTTNLVLDGFVISRRHCELKTGLGQNSTCSRLRHCCKHRLIHQHQLLQLFSCRRSLTELVQVSSFINEIQLERIVILLHQEDRLFSSLSIAKQRQREVEQELYSIKILKKGACRECWLLSFEDQIFQSGKWKSQEFSWLVWMLAARFL